MKISIYSTILLCISTAIGTAAAVWYSLRDGDDDDDDAHTGDDASGGGDDHRHIDTQTDNYTRAYDAEQRDNSSPSSEISLPLILNNNMHINGGVIRHESSLRNATAEHARAVLDNLDNEFEQQLRASMYSHLCYCHLLDAIIHRRVTCNSCGANPLRGTYHHHHHHHRTGIRYKCLNCPDYDLCCRCEAMGKHNKSHVFIKVRHHHHHHHHHHRTDSTTCSWWIIVYSTISYVIFNS